MKLSLIYKIDDKPPLGESVALGFQHYLTMFGSTVAVPLLLAGALGADASQLARISEPFFV